MVFVDDKVCQVSDGDSADDDSDAEDYGAEDDSADEYPGEAESDDGGHDESEADGGPSSIPAL